MNTNNTNIFDKISHWSIFTVITLLPLFFIPFSSIPLDVAKGLLLVLGLASSVIFWAIARFSDGKVVIPKSSIVLAGMFVVVVVLLSALFSGITKNVTMFGTMLDVGTFWYMLAAFLLMVFSAIAFKEQKRAGLLLKGMILSAAVFFVFELLFIIFPNKYLGLGILATRADNLLGPWHSFGFFAGLIALVIMYMMEFFELSKTTKSYYGFLLALSLFLVALSASSTFPIIWILVGVFALIIFVYKISINFSMNQTSEEKMMNFPLVAFIVVTISLLFVMSGQFLGGELSNQFGIQSTEVSPTLRGTVSIAKSVIKSHPVLGLGPNRFGEAWSMYKFKDINLTQFWDTTFNSGYSSITTMMATTGILGILSITIFFVFFLLSGAKTLFSGIKKGMDYKLMAFYIMSLYLFVASMVYTTGFVTLLLAFAFLGVFIGLSSAHNEKELSLSLLDDQRKSFFFMIFLIFVMISSIVVLFKFGERFTSVVYFRKAILTSDINTAEASINRAISLYQNDLYLRTFSEINMLRLDTIARKDSEAITAEDKANIQTIISNSVAGMKAATEYDPKNYVNFLSFGGVYQRIGAYGVTDANTNAIAAYSSALKLNPLNPKIELSMAAAYLANKNNDEAKKHALLAVELKPNYVDALIVLSQISRMNGDNADAIKYAETALAYFPGSKDIENYVTTLKGSKAAAPEAKTEDDKAPAKEASNTKTDTVTKPKQ